MMTSRSSLVVSGSSSSSSQGKRLGWLLIHAPQYRFASSIMNWIRQACDSHRLYIRASTMYRKIYFSCPLVITAENDHNIHRLSHFLDIRASRHWRSTVWGSARASAGALDGLAGSA